MQFLGSGRLRPLAVSTAKRARLLPDVPTMIESGIAGFDESGWSGILVPAGTPRAIVARLNDVFNKMLDHPRVIESMRREGADSTGSTPEEYARKLKEEVAKWADVVKRTGLHAN